MPKSILADASSATVAAEINRRTDREVFRPFGCVILAEHVDEWFGDVPDSPYMSFVGHLRPGYRERVPAVVHTDGTTRYQTLGVEDDTFMRRVLVDHCERTGVPLLLNTSFNRRGEPIL